jgi:hypothetical protein
MVVEMSSGSQMSRGDGSVVARTMVCINLVATIVFADRGTANFGLNSFAVSHLSYFMIVVTLATKHSLPARSPTIRRTCDGLWKA